MAALANVWYGVSVENREDGLPRIGTLRATPAPVRSSIEPLLEDLGDFDLNGINWVIVGGESGPGARPMEESWVLSIRDQCQAQGVPFFFKQWGGVNKKKTGRLLDGRTYDEIPRRQDPVTGNLSAPDEIDQEKALCRIFSDNAIKRTRRRFMNYRVGLSASD